MNQEKIGKFISELRKEKKLTQEKLAEQLNISKNAVSKWERGLNLPDISIMLELCKILEINIVDLLSGENTNTKYYIHRVEGSMIKKLTIENSLRGIKNDIDLSKNVISKIKDINEKTKNVTFDVKIDGFDIYETEKYTIATMEVSDDTGEITALLVEKGNKDLRKLIKELAIKTNYRINGSLTLNEEVKGNKLLTLKAIKRSNSYE